MPETQTNAPLLPRERLILHGAATLADTELLAIMLRTGTAGLPVVALASLLLQRFGSLRALLGADIAQLNDAPGLGPAKACQLAATMELARRVCEEPLRNDNILNQPDAVKRYCASHLGHLNTERCIALYLDSQLRLISCQTVSQGTINHAMVYPRELVRHALAQHASSLVLAHNHPGGSTEPSAADLTLTRKLKAALELVDIRLVDHLIIAGNQMTSLADRGEC